MHVEVSHAGTGASSPLRRILIIGGTGDLSRRHLLPALSRLFANGELPADFSVVVTGLESMSAESCRNLIAGELAAHAAHVPDDARRSLVERVSYLQADVHDVDALLPVGRAEPMLVYLAIPPETVPPAFHALCHAGIHRAPARIIFDKPFGLNRAATRALNTQVLASLDERNVYRVDHFLYHSTVQELVRWRVHSDPLSLVDLLPVTDVEIVWDETRALQSGRTSSGGVVRDMIQSHLLQLAAAITMKSPESMTHGDLAKHRLEALRQISAETDSSLVRGRHTDDAAAPPAPEEPETLVTLELRSQMPRWKHARFILRAAKGLSESRRHIELRFGHRSTRAPVGFVRLEVLAGKLAIGAVGSREAPVEFVISAETESASTRLLRAALQGDDTFTLHPEEPEEAWRIVEPVLRAWEGSDTPMLTYRVGAAAAEIERRDEESGVA